jgi:hypothetical protein
MFVSILINFTSAWIVSFVVYNLIRWENLKVSCEIFIKFINKV